LTAFGSFICGVRTIAPAGIFVTTPAASCTRNGVVDCTVSPRFPSASRTRTSLLEARPSFVPK
jgi:hypothetical protein